ncbi:type III-A CRISPR-associated RAMP protein Csm3 [Rhodothermus marinus]|uniref:CRISPR system Cms endoribonuclease Csm3 n=1 Tax=Rhodothermus marinus (strain ATCC 43812 / DSM 4252 / R-10) TaxID=518766 RepID=D0MKM7_RHOM4|nr:type III-A CRISPR-associated RAMP protein Csm3 [Rhodothermus marinus]ACY49691.1 CRISPR-associated RAMP protein, Csm3 family [Rhodothermus marinus DSM 4252]
MAGFLGNIILKGKMECLTGLHIGGSKEKFEIGGVDQPVIRDPATNYPYVPGSSLKGKMRALLSFALGKAHEDPNFRSFDPKCPLQRVFGTSAESRNIGPSRLIVRDAFPDEATIRMWENLDTELLYTEIKAENSVDRLTSAANPRFPERVVRGSRFNVEFVFSVYESQDADYFRYVIEGLRLLEHSWLGRSGTRGYGQVKFRLAEPIIVTLDDYLEGTDTYRQAGRSHEEMTFDLETADFNESRFNQIKQEFLKIAEKLATNQA